jgi:hypothetical protein
MTSITVIDEKWAKQHIFGMCDTGILCPSSPSIDTTYNFPPTFCQWLQQFCLAQTELDQS